MEFKKAEKKPSNNHFIFPNLTTEKGEILRIAHYFNAQNPAAFAYGFFEKAQEGKLTDLNEEMWSKLENTDSFDIPKGDFAKVKECTDYYNKETHANRDSEDLKQKMEQGQTIDAPIILKYSNTLHLVSGNTRLMLARAFGKIPKILLVEMKDKDFIVELDEIGEKLKNELLLSFETFTKPDITKLTQAFNLALYLHKNQAQRPDGAYINHILRVAKRIIIDFQIKDAAVSCASLLHDSVEDQTGKLSSLLNKKTDVEREDAFEYIRTNFGEDVVKIIFSVTNPETLEKLEPIEKNDAYVEHVTKEIQNPKVFYVKFSDFIDNGLNIENIKDEQKQQKLARKYLPLYQIFLDRIQQEDIEIPNNKKQELIDKLLSVKMFAENII